ncbi:SAS complex subunit [Coniosporium tulheliwenetii]|uniref:SAS complex subunit n=1 Tax=Coniosporium tulheliwenetii TaxID=3383036 RepID=A0ACC2ZN65_9PEZI|nr:SAS complex subunit [Cladosporium sp. JES 115]
MENNVRNVVLGDLLIKPWYTSFYPEELVGRQVDRLYVCQWCFKYSRELMPFLGHVDDYTIHEVDGEEHKLYSQNLSLFAKLFLDTKSVFYDTSTFLYYLLSATDASSGTRQVVGFFSKEKMSWDNNNLACILVFPPWQRQGLGRLLMGVSYELTLSELGRRGYLSFWSGIVARYFIAHPAKKSVTVREISDATYVLPEDIIATLKEMDVLEHRGKGGADAVVNKARVKAWAAMHKASLVPPVDVDAFVEGAYEDGVEDE